MNRILVILIVIVLFGCANSQGIKVSIENQQYGLFTVNLQTKEELDSVHAKNMIFEKASRYCNGKKLVEEVPFSSEPAQLISEGEKLPNITYFWGGTFSCSE